MSTTTINSKRHNYCLLFIEDKMNSHRTTLHGRSVYFIYSQNSSITVVLVNAWLCSQNELQVNVTVFAPIHPMLLAFFFPFYCFPFYWHLGWVHHSSSSKYSGKCVHTDISQTAHCCPCPPPPASHLCKNSHAGIPPGLAPHFPFPFPYHAIL